MVNDNDNASGSERGREEEVKRYNKLKNRQLELEVLIAAIGDHLKENGYLVKDEQSCKTVASGIRIKGLFQVLFT